MTRSRNLRRLDIQYQTTGQQDARGFPYAAKPTGNKVEEVS